MRISEINTEHVAKYLHLEAGEYDEDTLAAIMAAAKQYISDYTGIPISSNEPYVDTLDNHPDFYIVFMILCQDMYDNRTMYVDKSNVNRVVESILGMHRVNLV